MSAQSQSENGKTVRLDPQVLAAEFRALAQLQEHWLDKKAAAEHYGCSPRSIEYAIAEGMPHAQIFGHVKVRVSKADPWLEQHGYLERRGEWGHDGPSSNIAPAARAPRALETRRTSEVPDAS